VRSELGDDDRQDEQDRDRQEQPGGYLQDRLQ
jgi:hypothetical protein